MNLHDVSNGLIYRFLCRKAGRRTFAPKSRLLFDGRNSLFGSVGVFFGHN